MRKTKINLLVAFRLCHKFRSHSEHPFPAPSSKLTLRASLSGTFLQTHTPRASLSGTFLPTHTPSIAFRHLPPNSARFSYATEGALFISAQLSTDAVSALRRVWVLISVTVEPTLRAPLSGTFLQTLPDLDTPLKGHSLSPRSCPPTRSAPSEVRVLISVTVEPTLREPVWPSGKALGW